MTRSHLPLDMIVWGGGGSGPLVPRTLLVNFRNVWLSHWSRAVSHSEQNFTAEKYTAHIDATNVQAQD